MERPPSYELFFAPLEVALGPDVCEEIKFAYFLSKYGHAKQMRDGGGRYFDHPKGATWIYIDELGGRDSRLIIILLLHDISEDTYLLSPFRTSLNFGADIALDVRALTKLPKGKEDTRVYMDRVAKRGPWAVTAKLCDRLHNLRTLSGCSKEKQQQQIKETEEFHIPILIPALDSFGDYWSKYAKYLKKEVEKALLEIKN